MEKGLFGVNLGRFVHNYTNLLFLCVEFNIECTETHQKSAGEKISYLTDKLMNLRKQEVLKLQNNPKLLIGDVTTVNLTMLKVKFTEFFNFYIIFLQKLSIRVIWKKIQFYKLILM